jgi:type 1 fimbria pilin
MYVEGNSAYLDNILFVNDLNGVSYYNISGNMYAQPLMLTYRPQKTTCTFKNSGLTVTLPTLSLYQVINEEYAGYTPFVLNIKCNYQNNEIDITEQMIDIFLSSNNLLDSDNTVLIDNTENSAQGIGLRLVKTNNSENPLMISTTSNIRYEASSLLDHNEDSQLESYFSIPLAAYYYVWDQRSVSQGPINTNAVLNIIYP